MDDRPLMDPIRPDVGEILDQLQPVLDVLGRTFRSHGISVHEAETIVEESCRTLVAKRLRRQDPFVWLLHDIIKRCEHRERGGKRPRRAGALPRRSAQRAGRF